MIKKAIAIILSVLLLLSCAACGQEAPAPATEPATEPPVVSTTPPTEPETEPIETTAPAVIEADENLLTVDITLPASFFEGTDMSTFDTEAYAQEQGLLSAELNEDGSMIVTMTKGRHKEMLEELSGQLDSYFEELVEGPDTAYVKDISHNKDFTAVTVEVDRAAYENAFDFTPLAIGLSVSVYQAFIEMEHHVEISTVDADTGDVLNTVIYPDALDG